MRVAARAQKTAKISNLMHQLLVNPHLVLQREPHWHTEPVGLAQARFNWGGEQWWGSEAMDQQRPSYLTAAPPWQGESKLVDTITVANNVDNCLNELLETESLFAAGDRTVRTKGTNCITMARR